MKLDNKKIFETLNPNRVWVPVLIGLAIVFTMFYLDPNLTSDNLKVVVDASPFFIFLSLELDIKIRFVIFLFQCFFYVVQSLSHF